MAPKTHLKFWVTATNSS